MAAPTMRVNLQVRQTMDLHANCGGELRYQIVGNRQFSGSIEVSLAALL